MSEELRKRVKHATEMYYAALALDSERYAEEANARLVARADAAAAFIAFNAGHYAEAHFVARYARSRNPDLSNATHLRDSVWRDFEIACTAMMETSMSEDAMDREESVRVTSTGDAT